MVTDWLSFLTRWVIWQVSILSLVLCWLDNRKSILLFFFYTFIQIIVLVCIISTTGPANVGESCDQTRSCVPDKETCIGGICNCSTGYINVGGKCETSKYVKNKLLDINSQLLLRITAFSIYIYLYIYYYNYLIQYRLFYCN